MTGDDQPMTAADIRRIVRDEVDRHLLETLSEETANQLNDTLSSAIMRLAELEKSLPKPPPEPPTALSRRLKAVKDEEPNA